MEGFSPRNPKYMRAFAQAWSEEAIVQEALAQTTWYHNLTLIEKLKEREERLWYAQETVKNGWSRNVLVHWIESDLYERQGKASTNFEQVNAQAPVRPRAGAAERPLRLPVPHHGTGGRGERD